MCGCFPLRAEALRSRPRGQNDESYRAHSGCLDADISMVLDRARHGRACDRCRVDLHHARRRTDTDVCGDRRALSCVVPRSLRNRTRLRSLALAEIQDQALKRVADIGAVLPCVSTKGNVRVIFKLEKSARCKHLFGLDIFTSAQPKRVDLTSKSR